MLANLAPDPHVRRFLDRVALGASARVGSLAVDERRGALERLLTLGAQPPDVERVAECQSPGPAGPLRLKVCTPAGAGDAVLPALIYFHGGGLVAGSVEAYEGIARHLAHAGGCRVISVDYRLAPEARFPAALEDASAATEWVVGHAAQLGVDAHRLGVCGDSAGAALAAAVCQQRTRDGTGGIAGQVLLCPILDYRTETLSRHEFAGTDLLDRETLEHDRTHYLGQADPADPRVSPLAAAHFEGLPPACIHTAECDPVREDGHTYAVVLEQAGVKTRYCCHAGMIHLFYGLGAVIPYAAEAYRRIGADIRAVLGGAS